MCRARGPITISAGSDRRHRFLRVAAGALAAELHQVRGDKVVMVLGGDCVSRLLNRDPRRGMTAVMLGEKRSGERLMILSHERLHRPIDLSWLPRVSRSAGADSDWCHE